MCFYIGVEDLAANALIELLKKYNRNYISYSELEEYGAKVVQILSQKGEKAVLVLSRDDTSVMFRDYSEFFEEAKLDDGLGIILKEGKTINDLIVQFRGYLALDVLLAFVDKTSYSPLYSSAVHNRFGRIKKRNR